MIGRIARQHVLQFAHTGRDGIEFLGALEILEQDIGSVGSLLSVETVVNSLDRPDYKVHLAVVHLEPCLVALVIIVGLEAFDHLEQIVADALFDSDVGCPLQISFNRAYGLSVCIVIPNCLEAAVRSALNERIGAVLAGIVPRVEFFCCKVGRVETRACGFTAVSGEERLAVYAVPGSVVDLGIQFFIGRGE